MSNKLFTYTTRSGVDDHYYIRILDGKFVGVIYRYTVVKLLPPVDDDPPYFVYEFEIAESPNFPISTVEKNEEFKELMGTILNEIIEQSIENKKIKEKDIVETNEQ